MAKLNKTQLIVATGQHPDRARLRYTYNDAALARAVQLGVVCKHGYDTGCPEKCVVSKLATWCVAYEDDTIAQVFMGLNARESALANINLGRNAISVWPTIKFALLEVK